MSGPSLSPSLRHLRGTHLDLVEMAPEHFPLVVQWRNDPQNRPFFFSEHVWTLEGQQRWYESYLRNESDVTWTILLAGKLPVGTVAIYNLDLDAGTAEFGRLLIGDQRYRRQGLGYEASYLALAAAFEQLQLHSVYLEVFATNHAAIQLYERLGFVATEIITLTSRQGELPGQRMLLPAQALRPQPAFGATLRTLGDEPLPERREL